MRRRQPPRSCPHVAPSRSCATQPSCAIGASADIDILGDEQGTHFVAAMEAGDLGAFNRARFVLDVAGARLEVDCIVHRSQGTLIVELEPYDAPSPPVDVYAHVRAPIARMEELPTSSR